MTNIIVHWQRLICCLVAGGRQLSLTHRHGTLNGHAQAEPLAGNALAWRVNLLAEERRREPGEVDTVLVDIVAVRRGGTAVDGARV